MYRRLCVFLSSLALITVTVDTSSAFAQRRRSTGWAYAGATAGVLVPAFVAQVIMVKPEDEGESATSKARILAATTGYYASLVWGSSVGYYYSGNTRYATWSGIGKTAILGASIGADFAFQKKDSHPYLIALGTMAVLLWEVGDFVYLYRDVNKQNAKRRATVSVPKIFTVPRAIVDLGVTPRIEIAEDRFSLSLGGAF